jgi:uncharacterized protein
MKTVEREPPCNVGDAGRERAGFLRRYSVSAPAVCPTIWQDTLNKTATSRNAGTRPSLRKPPAPRPLETSAQPPGKTNTLPTPADITAHIKTDPRLSRVLTIIEAQPCADPAHDTGHALRVARLACHIVAQETEGGDSAHDQTNAIAASLLHDLVNLPKNDPNRSSASLQSAKLALRHFQNAGFSNGDAFTMSEAIRTHSLSLGDTPTSLVGEAVQDADRIEALGIVGVMRAFSTGGQIGSKFYDPETPWGHYHGCPWIGDDDTPAPAPAPATAPATPCPSDLQFIADRTLKIAQNLNTGTGRQMAAPLLQVTKNCLQQIGLEIGEPLPKTLEHRFDTLSVVLRGDNPANRPENRAKQSLAF